MRERIELREDNPLRAVIAGSHYKAYLVANLAFNDGPQAAAAEQIRLDLATVQAAMAFYTENEAAIHEAIQDARRLGEQLGARWAEAVLDEMKARKNAP